MCSFGRRSSFFSPAIRGTIGIKRNEWDKPLFFQKSGRKRGDGSSLWRREKNPPGRREGVAAMKKRLMVSLAVLMALWGGQALAQSAVVNNGSDPNSRLNMRDQPSRDASAVGQFYTGTPVEIVDDAGDGWSQVTIGGRVNSLSGYMMTRYLAEDASAVQDMTKEMQVVSPLRHAERRRAQYAEQLLRRGGDGGGRRRGARHRHKGRLLLCAAGRRLGRLPEHERGELIEPYQIPPDLAAC